MSVGLDILRALPLGKVPLALGLDILLSLKEVGGCNLLLTPPLGAAAATLKGDLKLPKC